jgi:hypothetical protein
MVSVAGNGHELIIHENSFFEIQADPGARNEHPGAPKKWSPRERQKA